MDLAPNLTSLTINRSGEWEFNWPQSLRRIRLATLSSLSLEGDHEFVQGWLSTISTPVLLALRICCPQLEASEQMFELIGATHTLRHLYFEFNTYDSHWDLRSMLSWFDELTELTTFQFLSNIPDCDDPEALTDRDARTIAMFFPNLRVLAVALATFDFFTQIVEMPHLEDLKLNAYFWSIDHCDARLTPCPGLQSLRFSGSPDHWVLGLSGCPGTVKAERFPNIITLEVVPGTGGILGDPSSIGH